MDERPVHVFPHTKSDEGLRKRDNAMAWPHLTGTVKIVVEITFNGKLTVNVHFARKQGGLTVDVADLVPLADDVYNAYDLGWEGVANANAEVTQISAIDWEIPAGQIRFTSQPLPLVGDAVGDSIPNNTALVVSNRTSFTGRSNRGRTYYTGLGEGQVTANIADGAVVTNFLLTSQTIGSNFNLNGYDHVVYSLYSGGLPRATPQARNIIEYEANSLVDTQRRRMP